jgi:fatty-acyl-CoA synthase
MDGRTNHNILTPLNFLRRTAAVYPDKTAIIYGETSYSYREFNERSNRLAWALRAAGLEHLDRVAILCPNIPPMLEAHFGVPLAGGVLVAINTRLSHNEIAYIINHSGARFLLVDSELADSIRPVLDQIPGVDLIVNIIDPAAVGEPLDVKYDYESFLAEAPDSDPVEWWVKDEDELITINYTSGTTGTPKGVMFCHRGVYINVLGEMIETVLGADSVYLWTLPMFHCNGWCFTWAVSACAGTHICMRRVDPALAWELITEHKVSHLNGAPVVLTSLLAEPGRPQQLSTPLTVCTGGAPPSPTLIEQMESLGARLVHIYGLTETYGPHTVNATQPSWSDLDLEQRARMVARQGVCYIATEPVRVVDEQMQDVPADGETMGEVVMQGNNVMIGYYDEPEATTEAFRGGWFHSGDLAVMHADGYIELRDRGKDIIISGGENISSIEVEQVICRHPSVQEVAVIGIPHEKWGESPKAFVTLKKDQELTGEELIEFCRDNLSHFKCPTSVEFTELPKTSTGKVQKYALREKEWEGHGQRIQG